MKKKKKKNQKTKDKKTKNPRKFDLIKREIVRYDEKAELQKIKVI